MRDSREIKSEFSERLDNWVKSDVGKKQLIDSKKNCEILIKHIDDNNKINIDDLKKPFNL